MEKNLVEYAKYCLQEEAQSILNLTERIDVEFLKAIELITSCKGKVIVTGVGKSGHVGHKIAATFASLGTPAFYLNPLDAYHGDLGMVDNNDLVIAISYSGQTDELLRILPLLINRHISIIGISGNPESLLAKNSVCHLNIAVEREADYLNLAPTSSTTATLAMGDALACVAAFSKDFSANDFALFHPGGSLGKRLLMQVKEIMRTEELPIVTKSTNVHKVLECISSGKAGIAVIVEDKKVKGIITSGDMRRAFEAYGEACFDTPLEKIMTANPQTIKENDTLAYAEKLFQEKKKHILIVVNEADQFVGLLDINDIK